MEALATYRTARLVWVRRMSNVKRIGALAAGFTGIAVIALPAIWTLPIARQELQISHLRGAPSPPLRSLAS